MNTSSLLVLCVACAFAVPSPAQTGTEEITTSTMLDELADLARLARLDGPAYRVHQYSSTDRRSKAPGTPEWFSNSDGFGGEPIPNFEAVLREPDDEGVGLYLVCDVEGPGAIVRGWSAGMAGTMRVILDGADTPIFEGTGYDFLARRSRIFFAEAGIDTETGDALIQQDADYLPMPFAKHLRVTYEGKLRDLHFYALEVRRWDEGTAVRTFAKGDALREAVPALERAVRGLVAPAPGPDSQVMDFNWLLNPNLLQPVPFVRQMAPGKSAALTEMRLRVEAEDIEAALRGVVLRISFDGHRRPDVLAPLGDFFGTGVGVNPFESLPLSVEPDGTMICRWVMPFEERIMIAFHNTLDVQVPVKGTLRFTDWDWDDRSLHFHAWWRHDPAIDLAGKDPIDLTFLRADGKGRLVGVSSILLNPSPTPTPWGNWWGEGDEKIFVDGETYPSFLGTGSEDYYNYSWSRPDLFDHPYCGQPLDTGPGNSGHVVNYRWHILDDVPFDTSLLFNMELWHHRVVFPISYARMAYWYAQPGGMDDFEMPMMDELVVPRLPTWKPEPILGSANSAFFHPEDLVPEEEGKVDVQTEGASSRGRVLHWAARAGQSIAFPFSVQDDGDYGINIVMRHRPDGAVVRVLLDGEALPVDYAGGSGACARGDVEIPLTTRYVMRMLSLGFPAKPLTTGKHTVTIECVKDGDAAFDYVWVKTHRLATTFLPGAVEAETAAVVDSSPGVEWEVQGMASGAGWSGDQHLWVRATERGQFLDLRIPVAAPGAQRVKLHLTRSYDYGKLSFLLDGQPVGGVEDTFSEGIVKHPVVDLGVHELGESFVLRLQTAGTNPASRPPHYYFGIDCVVLEPTEGDRP